MEEATVTRGGIATSEIDPKTMESRLCPGLSFAGEVIDVDGPCGGYHLQMCWSTGAVAGSAAAC
jgi:predicted flavoprotein YhiN